MTLHRSRNTHICYWLGCMFSLCLVPLHAQTTSVRGLVTDLQGKPIASAAVTLQCGTIAGTATPLATKSDTQGVYTFNGVRKLLCRLGASSSGCTAKAQLDLTQAQADQLVIAPDLVLAMNAIKQGTPTAVSIASAPPTFEASGIRGLIDPGGYSAPAGAAAASSLLSGMADVRRTGPDSAAAASNAPPCTAALSLLRSVQGHPGNTENSRNLADFYMAHGHATLALPYLTSAHQSSPTDIGVLLDLARAQIALEHFADARATLAALPSSSTSAQAHVLMAQASEGLGMFTDAATQYSLAQEHDPSIENIFGQGYELILAASLPAANQVFKDGLKRYPQSVRLLIGKGVAEYLGGPSSASVTTFLAAVAADPADAQSYPFLAQAYLVSGEHAGEVRAVLRDHIASSSGDGTAYYLLALVLSRSTFASATDDAEMIALLRKAIVLDPGLVMAHFRLGIMLARKNDNEGAAGEFEQVLHLQPTLEEAHFRLAGIYRKLGRTDAAAREMAIFRGARPTGEALMDETGLDLRQFVSVMHRSDLASIAADCPLSAN